MWRHEEQTMKGAQPAKGHACNIYCYEYDASTGRLVLIFNDGRTLTHVGVPAAAYEAFDTDPSPGRFYAKHIQLTYPVDGA